MMRVTTLYAATAATGATLGHPLVDRTLSNGKVIRAVAGFDATTSPCERSATTFERFGATTRVRSNEMRMHPDTNGLKTSSNAETKSASAAHSAPPAPTSADNSPPKQPSPAPSPASPPPSAQDAPHPPRLSARERKIGVECVYAIVLRIELLHGTITRRRSPSDVDEESRRNV
jgi:hypothetical protein